MEERVVAQGVELVAAEVVAAALHVADFQGSEEGFEERDVFEEELFLEVFGARGNDDALLALAGHAEGGKQVGQGFAGTGAGFDYEVALFFEGFFDGLGHLVLASAMLEGEGGLRENASGREEVVEIREILRWDGCDRDGGDGRQCLALCRLLRRRGFAISIIEAEANK